MMPDSESPSVVTLETRITERYGLLLSQSQLAELLGRTTGGLCFALESYHGYRRLGRDALHAAP